MLKLSAKRGASRILIAASVALGVATGAGAEVSFQEKILPILKERCFSCHAGTKDKGELKLDSVEAINKGGENGVVIVAGKPEESTFYKLLMLPGDDPDIMPAKGDPLTDEQKKLIFDWITEGAKFGDWKAEEAAPAPAAN